MLNIKLLFVILPLIPIISVAIYWYFQQKQNRLSNFYTLAFTFLVIFLITTSVASVITLKYMAIILLSPAIALALFIFPLGLYFFIENTTANLSFSLPFGLDMIIAWVPYLILFLLGSLAKKRYVFNIIYLIFITLLVINMAGCIQDAKLFCPDGGCDP